ncbi:MAG TPA: ABC transporter transmembrane domain-containing protein [Vicinamibacterales bacterium]|nr:ABC transporter transmembrane domain-containing protein [Vicinamibacterales bacterium]
MNEFQRLLRQAAPYRGRLLAAVAAMLAYAAGQAGLGLLVKPIFDDALALGQPDRVGAWTVQALAIAILVTYVLKGLGAYLSGYWMTDVGQRVVRDLRNRLFRHILDQSAAFFSRRSTGQLLSRITNDVMQVQVAASETAGDLIRESLTLIGWIALMFYYDWRLAIVCLTAAPLVVYPLVRLGQRVRRTTRRSQEDLEHLTHRTSEAFSGHRIVKAFGAEAREERAFAETAQQLYRTNMRVTSAVSVLPPLMEFIGGLALVGALMYGSSRIGAGTLTPGQFSGFLFAAFMMYAPIKKLSRVNASLQQAMAAAQRIFEMLDTHTEVHDRPGAPALARLTKSVEFRDVGFAYEDRPDQFVLRGVSFTVPADRVVAIVGLSGAGKTTLVNLIPRFFDVTEGAILFDGVDVRERSLASLRAQTALVTQDTVLFDDTIAANIAYGRPTASPAEIEAAARAAHAHEFVQHLDGGYGARIGERGQRLSGGQRQRIAIARALLKDAPVLLLDEATSALDAESEMLVQDALANLMRNRTTFVIAHRLSTVRRADMIVALEQGRVAEIGTHESLVGRPGGVYAKLYALQAFDDKDSARGAAEGGAAVRERHA